MPTITKSTVDKTLVGVAFYDQPGLIYPRWALVLHQKHYNSRSVRVYQIRRHNDDDWALDHRMCHLKDLGDLIGVLHLTVSPYHIDVLDTLVQTFPAGKASLNPGQVFAWGPSAWVIRALSELHDYDYAIIPGRFRARHFWDEGVEWSFVLRRKSAVEGIPMILWPTT